jgi:hypothetical protein
MHVRNGLQSQALAYMDEVCLSLGTLIGWKVLVLLLTQMFELWLLRGNV